VTVRFKWRIAFGHAETKVTSLNLAMYLCTFIITAWKYRKKMRQNKTNYKNCNTPKKS